MGMEIMQQRISRQVAKQHTQVMKLTGKIEAAKALGAFVSMRESKGLVSPMAMGAQQVLLGGARKKVRKISPVLYRKTARTEILTGKVHGLFDEVALLKQELRERPEVTKPFWDLGGLGIKKEHLILAAAGIGALLILPPLLGRFGK